MLEHTSSKVMENEKKTDFIFTKSKLLHSSFQHRIPAFTGAAYLFTAKRSSDAITLIIQLHPKFSSFKERMDDCWRAVQESEKKIKGRNE